jgi:putative membrane protein
MPLLEEGRDRAWYFLCLMLLLYVGARFLRLFSNTVPAVLIVVLHVLPPALFAIVHGKRLYTTRGILAFVALCLVVGAFFESLALRTGFPFGRYFFTGLMGPKLFQLPVLLVLAYIGMGYLAWIVGLLMLGSPGKSLSGSKVVFVPLVASLVMVAWDLAMDPVWANIDHAWVWKDGGAYFGVPVSNFFGWYLTVYVIYQAFALYLRDRPVQPIAREYYRMAVLFYAASAAGNMLLLFQARPSAAVVDQPGRRWIVSDIVGVCVVVSIFVMGAFAVTAWSRLGLEHREWPQSHLGATRVCRP